MKRLLIFLLGGIIFIFAFIFIFDVYNFYSADEIYRYELKKEDGIERYELKWSDDERLTEDRAGSYTSNFNNGWSLATDSTNRVHIVWQDNRSGSPRIYYKRSSNNPNKPWSRDVMLTSEKSVSSLPSIAVDKQNVNIVWQDNRNGNEEIYFKQSLDGGEFFGPDVRLTNNSAGSFSPSVAANELNQVHVVWQDNRDGNPEIYYKRSIQAGVYWEPEVRLTNDSANSYSPSVATDERNNIVHVVWQDNRDGNPEIYYKRSLNGGKDWEPDVRLTKDSTNSYSPSIAVDSEDRVHVVWYDDRKGNFEIFYKRSIDRGMAWEPDVRITVNKAYSMLPSIVIDPLGKIHVVWWDERDGNLEIYYKLSLTGGDSWEADIRLTKNKALSYFPFVATDSLNRIHVVWYDYREGNYEIYYKKGVLALVEDKEKDQQDN